MTRQATERTTEGGVLPDPAVLHHLLADVRFAPLWLVVRLFAGWMLIDAGWLRPHALSGAGQASSGALGAAEPLAIGLTLTGIAVILGLLTGAAAFAGGVLSAGLWPGQPLPLAALQIGAIVWLALAWKTAGWIGLDRWLLPAIGMPWRGGMVSVDLARETLENGRR
jgi:thiosulfate dehydrogenase [quinone] large subunit